MVTVNSILMTSEKVSGYLCSEKNKTFKVCKHASGDVLRDKGWKRKVGNHVLMDFIIFNFLLTSYLDILAKITNSHLKEKLPGCWSVHVNWYH